MKPFRRLARFGRDDEASLSIEAAMMVPLIVWIYVSTYTYFEAFRADSINVKASYTISDLLSREEDPVNAAYINGMNQVFNDMVLPREQTWIRVSSVSYDPTEKKYTVQWSHATQNHPAAKIEDIQSWIPVMSGADTVIVVETYMPYTPEFNMLSPMTYRNVVVTRPRFAPQLKWSTS